MNSITELYRLADRLWDEAGYISTKEVDSQFVSIYSKDEFYYFFWYDSENRLINIEEVSKERVKKIFPEIFLRRYTGNGEDL